jgi:hypothetical protein
MRDFLYVSERKVDRMAPTLPPRVAQRLKELRFNAGPVGAGVVLADHRAETAVAAVIEVEQAIYDEFRVRDVTDPELAAGDWFSADAMEMAYGVQTMNPELGTGTAVFVADVPNLRLLLSGSAQYLLDRSVPQSDPGWGMSSPQGITRMLWTVIEDLDPPDSSYLSNSLIDSAAQAHPSLWSEFATFGLQPLKFLARTIGVTRSAWDRGSPLVLGTPLFVEFARKD